jgi:iron(III) transport system permease protein
VTAATSLAPSPALPGPAKTHRSPRGLVVFAALVGVPLLIPLVLLAWRAVWGGPWKGLLPAGRLFELALNTLLLVAAVVVSASAIGLLTAWLTSRTDLPGRLWWSTLAALPLVIPSYVGALALLGATGRQGLVTELIAPLGLGPLPTPRGFLGAWIALSLFTYPYVHLLTVPAIRALDQGQEEAARGFGAGRMRLLRTVTLPQLSAALRSSALLVALYTMADFGAVSLLHFDTFTRAIYLQYAGRLDRRPATVLALALMIIAVTVVWVERRSRPQPGMATGSVKRPLAPVHLRTQSKIAGVGFLGLLVVASLLLPVAILVGWWVRGMRAGREASLVWVELGRSVGVSVTAAVIAAAVAVPLAMLTVRYRSKIGRLVESTVWTVYSLPHLTVGLAVLLTGVSLLVPLYQTLPLLLFAYVAMFLAQTLGPAQAFLARVPISLEEASRSLGKSETVTAFRVTVPLMSPGLLAGAGLVFLTTMKELPATLLLRPTGFETLAVRIWSATSEGFYTRASIAALVLLVASAVPLQLLVARELHD